MAMPIPHNAAGVSQARVGTSTPPKEKTHLEQAEELLDRASKELRAMREENERLRQVATAYEYLKYSIDMTRSLTHRDRGIGVATVDASFEIEEWLKDMQEQRLQGVLQK